MKITDSQWNDFWRAKKNGYKPCIDGTDEEQLIHFIYYHRWHSANSLARKLKTSDENIYKVINIKANCKDYEQRANRKIKKNDKRRNSKKIHSASDKRTNNKQAV